MTDSTATSTADTTTTGTEQQQAPAAPSPADIAARTTTTTATGQDQQQATTTGDGLPNDPEQLKALIASLRRENASERTSAKATAAAEARTQLAQDIGKALGLVKDDGDAPSPEDVTRQVTEAQAAARTAQVELAVYRAAPAAGGDPAALLDSRAFLTRVADLDPTGADFQTQVTDAIKTAVTENPKLAQVQVAGTSSVDHAGGSGEANRSTYQPGMSIADALTADAAR